MGKDSLVIRYDSFYYEISTYLRETRRMKREMSLKGFYCIVLDFFFDSWNFVTTTVGRVIFSIYELSKVKFA